MDRDVAFTTCPFCEATCGLELTLEDGAVTKIRGDAEDVFSKGFICPKGNALKGLHEDPDRVRAPLRKNPDTGEFEEVSWDVAFAEIDERLSKIFAEHGRDAVGAYLGNPSAHGHEAVLYTRALLRAIGSKNIFSASTVDQMPKHVSVGHMFGTAFSVPIPDIDRTDHMLLLGANPLASNGSLMTAPDYRGRLRAIQERGGKFVVVDPRRSRTAEVADEHHFIVPGTDALLLFALVNVLYDEGLVSVGDHLEALCDGIDELEALAAPFTPDAVAPVCGIEAEEIRRMARELAGAERAVVYGRIGTCTQEFGTLASWLVDVLNVVTGNLDREGGAMFPRAAAGGANTKGAPGVGRGMRFGRWQSRVRGLGETLGELPVSCMSEEMETPGEGQIRALFTVAGNPAVSTPNSGRLEAALDGLDLMVCVDIYVNETTRHADFILPAPSPLEKSHYDIAFYQFAIRNTANYSPALFDLDEGMQPEWRTLLRLTGIAAGQGPDVDVDALDDFVASSLIQRELRDEHSPLFGRSADDVMAALEPRTGPDRLIDLLLRAGPYDLTLDDLEAAPHGIDLGALEPRLPEALRTASGKIEVAPAPIVADVPRLEEALGRHRNGGFVLVGRRQLRSNNSWLHNMPTLVKGKPRCTVHVHPDDASRLGLVDGEPAAVSSRVGEVEIPVEVTDAVMPGVVSIPHGWGHDEPGVRMTVASEHAGTNSNVLADEELMDPLSGNAVLNGIPVSLAPVRAPAVVA
jgi:anaerobic selenocysteine-containing dehydrogenase